MNGLTEVCYHHKYFPIKKVGLYDRGSGIGQSGLMRIGNLEIGMKWCEEHGYCVYMAGFEICSGVLFYERTILLSMLESKTIDTILVPGGFDRLARSKEVIDLIDEKAQEYFKNIVFLEADYALEAISNITKAFEECYGINSSS
jgi:hypothetical protein